MPRANKTRVGITAGFSLCSSIYPHSKRSPGWQSNQTFSGFWSWVGWAKPQKEVKRKQGILHQHVLVNLLLPGLCKGRFFQLKDNTRRHWWSASWQQGSTQTPNRMFDLRCSRPSQSLQSLEFLCKGSFSFWSFSQSHRLSHFCQTTLSSCSAWIRVWVDPHTTLEVPRMWPE